MQLTGSMPETDSCLVFKTSEVSDLIIRQKLSQAFRVVAFLLFQFFQTIHGTQRNANDIFLKMSLECRPPLALFIGQSNPILRKLCLNQIDNKAVVSFEPQRCQLFVGIIEDKIASIIGSNRYLGANKCFRYLGTNK